MSAPWKDRPFSVAALPGYDSEDEHDAITAEELTGTATPDDTARVPDRTQYKRPNAFAELMATSARKKPKPEPEPKLAVKPTVKPTVQKSRDPRDGLLEYIEKPETNPGGRVVEYDDDFVVIRDMYPKATVHLLLLPRDPSLYTQHPLHVLSEQPAFLAEVRTRVEKLKALVASELRRLYGASSASDAPYQTALEELMSSPDPPPAPERAALLPPGRDWPQEVVAGVHTHPSMNHLHVHILSREMHSACMKHKKHYLSFHTSFLVQLDEFPLEPKSKRFRPGDWPNWDMECWRCGKSYGNQFAALKRHLEKEFETWKNE
ncbi:HIT-like domain-containing protein [Massariosphaeria phaeospora]|uniref:Aprataxin-like protein n=1 Tax=Massariosphaeria phaeospora TaxID=100035 RepID=A0A7C8ICF2_9PLEO|nr:HIT-like domain-containing protein [Massariosphaeria phaeospora]